jgi:hypothetical protein
MLVLVTPIILDIFLLENPIKETMNYSNVHFVVLGKKIPKCIDLLILKKVSTIIVPFQV